MRTRRKFTGEFKSRVVLEVLSEEKTLAEACREYKLTAQTVKEWRAQFLASAPQLFQKSGSESEDEDGIGQFVGKGLYEASHVVDWVRTAPDGLNYALSQSYDVMILDIIL
ncbi:MAG: transposase [Anaerolineae bacterium]|nr:transposase [Anaerolineae bacterium]